MRLRDSPPQGPALRKPWASQLPSVVWCEHSWLLRLHHLHFRTFDSSAYLPRPQAPLPAFCMPPVWCQVSSPRPRASPRPCYNAWDSFHLFLMLPVPGLFCHSTSLFTLAALQSLLPRKSTLTNPPHPQEVPPPPTSFFLRLAKTPPGQCPPGSWDGTPRWPLALKLVPVLLQAQREHLRHHCKPQQTAHKLCLQSSQYVVKSVGYICEKKSESLWFPSLPALSY